MITNETEIRIALQSVLVSVLALNGYWGCALIVLLMLLPWRPIFAVVGYLAQPVVEWRMQKARDRNGKETAQIEQELDNLLHGSSVRRLSPQRSATRATGAIEPLPAIPVRRWETLKPGFAAEGVLPPRPGNAQSRSVTMSIMPVIKEHLQTLRQRTFINMDLEVEQVKFHGETADAFVRFQSPNVMGLLIRQRYTLRKSGEQWLVESRQPALNTDKPRAAAVDSGAAPMQLT